MDSEALLNQVLRCFLEKLIANGATSASFALFANQQMQFFQSSDKPWQEFYANSEEAKHCHIRNHGVKLLNSNIETSTIIWDALQINNDESRFLNEMRIKNNRCHGISLCQKLFDSSMVCIILTGARNNNDFVRKVFENKNLLLRDALNLSTVHLLLK